MRRFWPALTLLATVQGVELSYAHHSLNGVYESDRRTTVVGRVVEFRFVNPHPILVIDVAPDGADAELWQLEMDNRFELADIGIDAATYVAGDRVLARGSLAHTEPRRLYVWRLERPADGMVYEQIGSRPRLVAGVDSPD